MTVHCGFRRALHRGSGCEGPVVAMRFSHNDRALAHCCAGDLATMTAAVHAVARMWVQDNGCDGGQTTTVTGRTGWGS